MYLILLSMVQSYKHPSGSKYFKIRYSVDTISPMVLIANLPRMLLCDDRASIMRYLTSISLASAPSPHVVFEVLWPITSTCSPDNPIKGPMNIFMLLR